LICLHKTENFKQSPPPSRATDVKRERKQLRIFYREVQKEMAEIKH